MQWPSVSVRVRCAPSLRCLALVAALVAAVVPCGARAQGTVPEIKLSVSVAPVFPLGAAAKAWSESLAGAAGGAFTVAFKPGAALARGSAVGEFESLAAGGIDAAVGSALFWSEALPTLGAFALPWMAPTDAQVAAIVASPDATAALASSLARAGMVLVHWAPLAHRDLATQVGAIATPTDLAGLRVRTPATPLVAATYRALGAKPAVLTYAAAQAALAARELDAQDGTAATFASARIWGTGARQVVEWGAFADVMLFVVRRTVWDTWPQPLREAAKAGAVAAARGADPLAAEVRGRDALAANGVAVTRLTPAAYAAFRGAVQPVYDAWVPRMDAALVAAVQQAAESAQPR
ncbi:MAG: TRAP transporter substrate-binding protein DctP [Proteobacteria bacterium]|nr:TRAP transporter substrate-binding protein DctP [Pseudomonadota bacterium]